MLAYVPATKPGKTSRLMAKVVSTGATPAQALPSGTQAPPGGSPATTTVVRPICNPSSLFGSKLHAPGPRPRQRQGAPDLCHRHQRRTGYSWALGAGRSKAASSGGLPRPGKPNMLARRNTHTTWGCGVLAATRPHAILHAAWAFATSPLAPWSGGLCSGKVPRLRYAYMRIPHRHIYQPATMPCQCGLMCVIVMGFARLWLVTPSPESGQSVVLYNCVCVRLTRVRPSVNAAHACMHTHARVHNDDRAAHI